MVAVAAGMVVGDNKRAAALARASIGREECTYNYMVSAITALPVIPPFASQQSAIKTDWASKQRHQAQARRPRAPCGAPRAQRRFAGSALPLAGPPDSQCGVRFAACAPVEESGTDAGALEDGSTRKAPEERRMDGKVVGGA